jgi:hypothetical protein
MSSPTSAVLEERGCRVRVLRESFSFQNQTQTWRESNFNKLIKRVLKGDTILSKSRRKAQNKKEQKKAGFHSSSLDN